MKIFAINPMITNNRSHKTKSQITFGESEGDYFTPRQNKTHKLSNHNAKDIKKGEIENYYKEKLNHLIRIADESNMNNDVFWAQVKKFQQQKEYALNQLHLLPD